MPKKKKSLQRKPVKRGKPAAKGSSKLVALPALPGCKLPLRKKPLSAMTLKELLQGYAKERDPYGLWGFETWVALRQRVAREQKGAK